MNSKFTTEEKRRFLFRKHLKNHWFEYFIDMLVTVLFVFLLLKLCQAENIMLGIFLAIAYSLGRTVYDLAHYKKEFIDVK